MNHTHQHASHGHGHSHGHSHGHGGDDLAEVLDLDADVLADQIASIIDSLPVTTEPDRIVDLGAGTGAGTFALLDRFPDAALTAVDTDEDHLARLRSKAKERGVADRVRTVRADLDEPDWPDLGTPDLVWASASMHHMADPDRALRAVRDLLAPDGLFAVVELAGPPRFLPADAPAERPGLEDHVHATADRLRAESMPHRGADWGPMLTAAGFAVVDERTVAIDVDGAGDHAVGRYALSVLSRLRTFVAETLDPDDLAALDRLLDSDSPAGLPRRDDLVVRTQRDVWVARRSDTA